MLLNINIMYYIILYYILLISIPPRFPPSPILAISLIPPLLHILYYCHERRCWVSPSYPRLPAKCAFSLKPRLSLILDAHGYAVRCRRRLHCMTGRWRMVRAARDHRCCAMLNSALLCCCPRCCAVLMAVGGGSEADGEVDDV